MKEESVLTDGADRMMLRQSMTNLSQSDSLTEVNGKSGFNPIGREN